jgi:hypothetical protein
VKSVIVIAVPVYFRFKAFDWWKVPQLAKWQKRCPCELCELRAPIEGQNGFLNVAKRVTDV